ncbi:MAG: 7-cyano-7-deazaguanine synthase QueC [Actinobacteria bacterium]|nr:7-cyano-7-deazaguanine synthase QueC [Actinomycetota bacterium]
MAHLLASQGDAMTVISFNYGQRHDRELAFAVRAADHLDARHHLVDLSALAGVLTGSALTDVNIDVPDGHYRDESMRATVVPNRNAIFLSVATGLAVAIGADAVAIAVHAGDHPIYPDCRPAFIAAFETQARLANEGFAHPDLQIEAPFLTSTKVDIVRLGAELGVDFAATWSCYRGGDRHCGTCGTCAERREAFREAGVLDPTSYERPIMSDRG